MRSMTGQFDLALLGKALGALALILLLRFFVRLVQVRRHVRYIAKKYGIPMLPHSLLWGHLLVLGKLMAKYPRDTSGLAVHYLLARQYPDLCACGLVYLDTWPIMAPSIGVFHPDMAAQFTQETSLPKAAFYRREFYPFTQCKDLVSTDGQEWKTWRSIFSPGFSAKNLTALLPAFLEEIQVLKERLIETAKTGDVISLEKVVQKGTVDVICRAVLGIRLHSQTRDDPFSRALQNQISWLIFDNSPPNLLKQLNPLRPFALWNNNRIMRNFLAPLVQRSLAKYDLDAGTTAGPKTINCLAAKSYMAEVQAADASTKEPMPTQLDPRFVDMAISHLKLFIFAGHDTTASTLSFSYSLLFNNPHTLAALRAEHDAVLGPDPAEARAHLSAQPQLLNQMAYTSAVIKETLRLFPPAATARQGSSGFFLTHPETGKRYATDGFTLAVTHFATHRLEAFWERPAEFLPERWLAREGEPLHVRKNAYRPFELGQRNCIGQELALLELRAILAMTVRELDIESAYPEDAPTVLGEKAYQVMPPGDITGHVKGGFPIRVKIRES